MAYDNTVTIVGNAVNAPELRFTPGGMAVASFGLAWNRRKQDGDDEVSFFDISCFKQLAENVAETIRRGDRVVVYGSLSQRSWETDDGQKRSKVEIIADEITPSLRWATATVAKNERDNQATRSRGNTQAAAPAYDTDQEPF